MSLAMHSIQSLASSRHSGGIRLAVCLWLCLGVGCKVGPDFRKPPTTVADQWSWSGHPRVQGEPACLEAWWSHFQDPILDELIQQSLAQNFTLREASERILEAQARRAVTAGNQLPQLQVANGSFSQSQLSSTTANFFSVPGVFSPSLNPQNWSVGLSAAWELDFWGKYRRAVESADARLNAVCAAHDEVRILVLAEVAQAYITLRTLESRIQLAQQNLEVQQRTLQLALNKNEAGLATGLDVAQAETNIGCTTAVLPTLEIARRQTSHTLCVLLGRPPDDLSYEIGVTAVIPRPPENLAFGVPADLLRRRPDIRRVESELAAQSAKIGIAKTDFYPQIRLNGNIGFAAEEFGQLFNSRSQVGLISPSFSWNLLNYRRIKNNVAAETAAFRAQCNAYQSAVLKAAKEAEDAQVAFLLGFDRADALHRAVQGASDAVEKSEALYQAGTIDFGRVYVLQAERLLQQDQLAIAEGNIALSLVQLFKALGGGWQQAAVTVAQFDQLQLPIVAREVAWPAQHARSSDYRLPIRAVSAAGPINPDVAN
jgi:NodT family efflux transporter outer membrane factor (OMF) lipoprotein